MASIARAIIAIATCCVVGSTAQNCRTSFTTFHTKTAYDHVGNKDANFTKPHPSCTAVQLNAVHRHGHRYPSATHVRELAKLGKKLLKNADVLKSRYNITFPLEEAFKDFTEAQNKLLTSRGEDTSYHIAKRIKSRFPELFTKVYSPLDYKFRSTCKLRCVRTTNSLSYAFFEQKGRLGVSKYQPISIETADCAHDALLRPWDACEEWIEETEEHIHKALREYYKFIKGKEIASLKSKISVKAGFNASMKGLGLTDLERLFEACAYHINMFKGSLNDGICQLLDKEDIALIEYMYDLNYFYAYSAGHKLSYWMSCPLLSDIVRTLADARNNKEGAYTGVFRVGHQETLEPLLTLMGVMTKKGEVLKADNYVEMKNRMFRSACMAPYSGNVYFTLYRCADNEYKIQMYVNENLVKIPCCKSARDCNFDVFFNCYKDMVKKCNFKKMCDN